MFGIYNKFNMSCSNYSSFFFQQNSRHIWHSTHNATFVNKTKFFSNHGDDYSFSRTFSSIFMGPFYLVIYYFQCFQFDSNIVLLSFSGHHIFNNSCSSPTKIMRNCIRYSSWNTWGWRWRWKNNFGNWVFSELSRFFESNKS